MIAEQWWREYPPPSNPMERAAEQMELAAHNQRMTDETFARAHIAAIDRAYRSACQVSGRDPDAQRDPDPAWEDALKRDPCLLMRIQRGLGEELERWRASRAG